MLFLYSDRQRPSASKKIVINSITPKTICKEVKSGEVFEVYCDVLSRSSALVDDRICKESNKPVLYKNLILRWHECDAGLSFSVKVIGKVFKEEILAGFSSKGLLNQHVELRKES